MQECDLKGLRALMPEKICNQYIMVSIDNVSRKTDSIEIIYWENFIQGLPERLAGISI